MAASETPWANYIGGQWIKGSGQSIVVNAPATGQAFDEIAGASESDVGAAVEAARRAFNTRALYDMRPHDRMLLLFRIAAEIRKLSDEIVPVLVKENGKSVGFAKDEVECTAQYFEYYGGIADKVHGKSIPLGSGYLDYTQLVPFGVSAQIVPWNFPLEIAARAIAPALACGNAVVVKSPELSPLAMCFLATACARAGLPAGYFNLITGYGKDAGEALVSHPGVDQVVFTGSVETGRKILRNAAEKIIPAVVELGGKSAGIVYADADTTSVASSAAIGIFAHAGQVCSAGSRLIVHESIHDEVVEKIVTWVKGQTMGPGEEDHFFTPLISAAQRDKAERFAMIALQAGATAATGGRRPDGLPGFYMTPTVLTGVTPAMEINKHEVFGPVLSVLKFSDREEALSIANGTEYGLASGVYTKDLSLAHWTADRLEAGTVFVNQWFAGGNEVPFGGFKRSGFGREKGVEAMANYCQVRNVAVRI
ncbi:aldehyde dehydrogenase family protein [Labrys okinawensis]|uniref:aldehyde dehydrogenase family protein n=1 Tax=Labrys okinawensis TaxID=346911 RepID=UPI0039BD51C6